MTDAQATTSNFNLPNVLTTLRIGMVPFFGWALLHEGGDYDDRRFTFVKGRLGPRTLPAL